MAKSVHSGDVIRWIKEQTSYEKICREALGNGATGPDLILKIDGKIFCFEAIGFSEDKRGQNQSDFWKAFSQSLSRLNPHSIWEKPDYIVVAIPEKFKPGWNQRVDSFGSDVWNAIGNAFPKLQIWFVGESKINKFTWNDSYYAMRT